MSQKPTYSTTKAQMRWAFALAWMTIEALVLGALSGIEYALQLAPIVIPSMIVLIATLLGIHRFSGAMDFRAMQDRQPLPPSPPPYFARDEPAPQSGEIQ